MPVPIWLLEIFKTIVVPIISDIIQQVFFHPTKETVYEAKGDSGTPSADVFANP